jgi:hypothetical protein
MDEQQDKATGWKSSREAFKQFRTGVKVAAVIANPLAGPVAQHAHLEPVASEQAIVQQLHEQELTEHGHWLELEQEREVERQVEELPSSARAAADEAQRERQQRKAPRRDRGR